MLTECALLGLLVAVALTVAAFFRKRRAMCAPDPAYAAPLPPSLDPSGVEAFLAGRDEAAHHVRVHFLRPRLRQPQLRNGAPAQHERRV